jgi:hypothetical protein
VPEDERNLNTSDIMVMIICCLVAYSTITLYSCPTQSSLWLNHILRGEKSIHILKIGLNSISSLFIVDHWSYAAAGNKLSPYYKYYNGSPVRFRQKFRCLLHMHSLGKVYIGLLHTHTHTHNTHARTNTPTRTPTRTHTFEKFFIGLLDTKLQECSYWVTAETQLPEILCGVTEHKAWKRFYWVTAHTASGSFSMDFYFALSTSWSV